MGSRPSDPAGHVCAKALHSAANTPALHQAFDQLVGSGRAASLSQRGYVPVRFPSSEDPGDVGWHIDASFDFENPDFLSWAGERPFTGTDAPDALHFLGHRQRRRADPPPCRIAYGHCPSACVGWRGRLVIARTCGKHFSGVRASERSAGNRWGLAPSIDVIPFLSILHSIDGAHPRFMAQPPLLPRVALNLERDDGDYSPVELAIRQALDATAVAFPVNG